LYTGTGSHHTTFYVDLFIYFLDFFFQGKEQEKHIYQKKTGQGNKKNNTLRHFDKTYHHLGERKILIITQKYFLLFLFPSFFCVSISYFFSLKKKKNSDEDMFVRLPECIVCCCFL